MMFPKPRIAVEGGCETSTVVLAGLIIGNTRGPRGSRMGSP
jgi:hypothetical protein